MQKEILIQICSKMISKNDQEEKLDDSDFEIEENDTSKEKENELDNSFELNSNFEDSKDSIEQ